MLKIGLTGGIGCGKSVVSASFSEWGAYIFDAEMKLPRVKSLLNLVRMFWVLIIRSIRKNCHGLLSKMNTINLESIQQSTPIYFVK